MRKFAAATSSELVNRLLGVTRQAPPANPLAPRTEAAPA
jgi:hypothetical protein